MAELKKFPTRKLQTGFVQDQPIEIIFAAFNFTNRATFTMIYIARYGLFKNIY